MFVQGKKDKLTKIIVLIMCLIPFVVRSQQIDKLEGQFKKAKLVTINGGVSANAIYYQGKASRDPLTYFLNGNLNFNIKGLYNIPLSFSYTSQKFKFKKRVL